MSFIIWPCGPDLTLMWASSVSHNFDNPDVFLIAHFFIIEGVRVLMWILNSAPQDKRRLLRMQMQ